ncbi:MAG: hypothetical protein CMJ18_28350 [Phycisphaeraceae bacterium]|nr:hypothetical protein [Phycisphaeraceae bacterium]
MYSSIVLPPNESRNVTPGLACASVSASIAASMTALRRFTFITILLFVFHRRPGQQRKTPDDIVPGQLLKHFVFDGSAPYPFCDLSSRTCNGKCRIDWLWHARITAKDKLTCTVQNPGVKVFSVDSSVKK